MPSALHTVKKLYPEVTKVVDAKRDTEIEVTKRDTSSATVRNHKACAMAVACKRKLNLDGVIMSVSTAYLIKDNIATRYKVPEAVSREIVSFDRNSGFEPGDYKLKAISSTARLGESRGTNPKKGGKKNGNATKRYHKTENIRENLGAK